jgi:hypothetical protein
MNKFAWAKDHKFQGDVIFRAIFKAKLTAYQSHDQQFDSLIKHTYLVVFWLINFHRIVLNMDHSIWTILYGEYLL